ncbi:hypothetical protein PTKIN_Ptkin19aG0118800 [Pterospermum kingtungense]
MEIIIRESSMVRPAQDTPKGRLWLSNLDLANIRFHIRTVYFYKPNGCSDFFQPQLLKEALSKVLVPFYPVAGRLGCDENGRLEVICNEGGVLFVEAESTADMDQLIEDLTDTSGVSQLVPKVDYSGGISSYPLLLLQVTTFKCGGVCLGHGLQHTFTDGLSAFQFINSWADIARGSAPGVVPYIDRTLLRARVPPTPTFDHVEYHPPPTLNNSSTHSDPKPPVVSIFKLTVDQINTLKAKLSGTKYSTYKILCAHMWRCSSKARGLSDDQATRLQIPIDGRSRLNPPLPQGYLGNVILHAKPIVLVGDLLSEPLTNTVKAIDESVKQVNDEYVRSVIDYLEKAPDVNEQPPRCPNLSIRTWVWLPTYDADFGWGRPIYIRPSTIFLEGKILMLRSPTDDGSLLLMTCLETSHIELFAKFLYDL